jgi:hypothetical protein
MLCACSRPDEHVVPGGTEHAVSGLGMEIEEGCGVCFEMLVFRSSGSRLPGLGLKLGFRRWDRYGLHCRGGMMKSYQRPLVGRGQSGRSGNVAGTPYLFGRTLAVFATVDFESACLGDFLLEHLRGRARIGGQPVEVFFRERFGRVSGGEDYPDHAVFIEDRNCK